VSQFLDGPAADQSLMLRRAPFFLRVVQSRNGTWDALDQIDDEPKATEKLFVYVRVGGFTEMHLCARGGGKSAAGWYQLANYRLHEEQPDDATMRSRERWQAWCQEKGPPLSRSFVDRT
jgi:hypothetical protein